MGMMLSRSGVTKTCGLNGGHTTNKHWGKGLYKDSDNPWWRVGWSRERRACGCSGAPAETASSRSKTGGQVMGDKAEPQSLLSRNRVKVVLIPAGHAHPLTWMLPLVILTDLL